MPLGRPPAALTLRERAQVALDSHISTENQKLAERRLELWTEQLKVSAADVLRCWSEELELEEPDVRKIIGATAYAGATLPWRIQGLCGQKNGSSGRTRTYNPPVNSRKIKPGVRVHSMT